MLRNTPVALFAPASVPCSEPPQPTSRASEALASVVKDCALKAIVSRLPNYADKLSKEAVLYGYSGNRGKTR